MNDRILSLLGLCRRAGKVTIGNDAVIDMVTKQKAKLVIMAKDLSKNTAKGVLVSAHMSNVKALTINRTKDELSAALGKFCAVVSVNDGGFANKFETLISQENQQEACI